MDDKPHPKGAWSGSHDTFGHMPIFYFDARDHISGTAEGSF